MIPESILIKMELVRYSKHLAFNTNIEDQS